MKASDYIASFIQQHGVNDVYGYIGGMITHLVDSIARTPGMRFIQTYHEQSAAFAAEGYAIENDKLGVAISTSGPGATNMITGIADAWFGSVPVLYISGQVNSYEYKYDKPIRQQGFQETDIISIVKPITKYAALVDKAENLRYELEKAVYYAQSGGHNEFIICAGYKQEYIKEWFANYFLHNSDVSFDFRGGNNEMTVHHSSLEPWKVTVVDTGYNTMTGGRIKRVQEYVGNETFMMTYGDGVCDVDINKLIDFHKSHGKIATLTAVKMAQEKGVLDIEGGAVKAFREKNANDGAPINAGYMVLEPAIFNLLGGDSCIFERKPLETLVKQGELMSYIHEGFWQCMDNIREKNRDETFLSIGKL